MKLPILDFAFSLFCVAMGAWLAYLSLKDKIKKPGTEFESIHSSDDVVRQLRSVQLANKKMNERLERIENLLPGFRAFEMVREEQSNIRSAISDIFGFLINEQQGEQNETTTAIGNKTRRITKGMG